MAVDTEEQFEDLLESELAWRRAELHALKSLLELERHGGDTPTGRALSRSMLAMLYAHWEGYSKAVLSAYLKFVLRRKPIAIDAAKGLLLAHARQIVRRYESGDTEASSEFLELVRGTSRSRLRIVEGRVIDTKSNLRFAVLQDILSALDLPIEDFATRENLIDALLCDRRNEIAHGRANFPTREAVLELHEKLLEMLQELRDLAVAHIRVKGYLVAQAGV